MSNNTLFPSDAHCHLDAIINAHPEQKLAVAAIKPLDILKLSDARANNQNIKIGVGLHPWYVDTDINLVNFKVELEELIIKYKPDFIGECGLDKLKPNFDLQIEICKLHCELAIKYNLPIVFHCVRSYNELLQLLAEYQVPKGLVHAFNGNNEMAKQFWKKNIYLGIGSNLMNEQSQLYKSIARMPIEQLITESDAPYMPYAEQEISTPQNCMIYLEKICELKSINPTETIGLINQNWTKLYS
jgi:TatD DNase family protein